MENRLSALERWVSKQEKVITEMKTDVSIVKDNLPEELLQDIKKGEKYSDKGRLMMKTLGWNDPMHGNRNYEDEQDTMRTWT